MASNLTIESPNFDKIKKEAGQFTRDAVNVLWAALNDTRAMLRRGIRETAEAVEPKVLTIQPSSTVSDLDLQGCSVVSFVGSSAINFTGMRAPETGAARIVWVQVSGSGTITAKHNTTSETQNQLTNSPGTDFAMSTGKGITYVYLASKWREVSRSG